MYDEFNATTAVTIASLVESQHANTPGQSSYAPGTCAQCTPAGCAQKEWADKILAEHRAAREAFRNRTS